MFTGRSSGGGGGDYSILDCTSSALSMPLIIDSTTAKWKCTNVEIAPSCPRCASANTKFCYYNNYSLSQPRYFCKACRRYWTKGGSLRNVPVGGGCRKSRRARAAAKPPNSAAPAPAAEPEAAAACIDLAAVFAKYVSRSAAAPGAEESFSSGSSDNNNNCDYGYGGSGISGAQVDLMGGGDYGAVQEMDGQDYVYQDFGGFDQLQRDVMWAEGTTDYGGAHVQPMMQQVQQDFGLISPDDQFRISANLAAENNWGAFDPSAYEFFSNP